jgi:glutamate 5-kinase
MLTDTEGIFVTDPKVDPEASLISLMEDVDDGFVASLTSTKSGVGTGGMVSKMQAAKTASVYGVPSIIANGKRPRVLEDILDGKDVGTMVLPKEGKINSWKHWIAYSKIPSGALVVDQGARRVIVEGGKSLLPTGIRRVSGDFAAGDSVSFLGENDEEFARGLVNYSSDEIRRIQGEKTSRIEKILGYKYYDEIVHRDDLVLIR